MRTYVRRPRKPFRSAVDHTDRAMTTEPETRGPSPAALIAIGAAAVAAGALVDRSSRSCSDHREPAVVWAVFGPLVGWSFIAAGVYAWRIRPRYRTGELMILLGFAWFLFTLDGADDPTAYTLARILGGLWGSVFLHLGLSFPTGRLKERADRVLVLAGYVIFPLAGIPQMLFAGPADLGCADCPDTILLIDRNAGLADAGLVFGTALYLGLFVAVLHRAIGRWRRSGPVRPAAADAGLPLLAADLPARHDRPRGRRRRRLVGRVHRHRADAVRVPRRAAAQPGVPARRAAPGAARRPARVARPARPGRRRRAPAARARPARRRAVAARRALAAAAMPRASGPTATRSSPGCSTRRRTSCRPASPSCASWRAGSTRRCSAATGSRRRSTGSPRGRRCRSRSRRATPSGCPRRSRAPPTSWSRRRSSTWPSTPARRRPPSASPAPATA